MRRALVAGLASSVCLAAIGCKSSTTNDMGMRDMTARADDMAMQFDLAPNVSRSKLAPHVFDFTSADPNVAMFLAACPRVAHFSAPTTQAKYEIPAYRAKCTGGQVVLRISNSVQYKGTDDPVADADDNWSRMTPYLSDVTPSEIDWLEGPNEFDNINWVDSFADAQWYAKFWSELADKMHAAGYAPLIGSLQIGNIPSMNVDAGTPDYFCPLTDAMKAKGYRWGWSPHSYTFSANPVMDAQNYQYFFSYRTIHDQCGLAGVPIVITEGGYLTPGGQGWVGQISPQQYLTFLEWADGELQKDSDVVGITLFQVGDHDVWKTFALDGIMPQLLTYLAQ